jgi:hypothetical protein
METPQAGQVCSADAVDSVAIAAIVNIDNVPGNATVDPIRISFCHSEWSRGISYCF